MIKKENIYIVLVEPKIPENIGFVARLMKNFGFKNLIIVNPRCDLEKAKITATHGVDVLENAKIVKELNFSEFDFIVATSGKVSEDRRAIRRRYIIPEELVEFLKKLSEEKVAILFGREDIGLTNEEIDKCHVLLHIPADKEFPILNLSHSVGIILYVIFRNLFYEKKENIAEKYRDKVSALLNYVDFFVKKFEEHKIKMDDDFKVNITKTFSNLLVRAKLNEKEFSTLLGFFNKLRSLVEKLEK